MIRRKRFLDDDGPSLPDDPKERYALYRSYCSEYRRRMGHHLLSFITWLKSPIYPTPEP